MGNDRNFGSEDEQEAAKRRIDDILGGGQAPAEPSGRAYEDALDDVESDAVSRARGRASSARARLGMEEPAVEERVPRAGRVRPAPGASTGRRAIMIIGGVVGAGIVLLIIILLVAQALGGQGITLPGFATATPTFTPTPPATETPTPTATFTPTRPAPELQLPPLTCIFQSGTGCTDYCNQAENTSECNAAREFIRAQGADPEAFFRCLSPGTGPNQGNPQDCLRQAWYARNP